MRLHQVGMVIAVMGCFFAQNHAHADVVKLNEVAWWAAYGGIDENGKNVCALVSHTTDEQGGRIVIEHFAGAHVVKMRLVKETWKIPDGMQTTLGIAFGYGKPTFLAAVGAGNDLIAEMSPQAVDELMNGIKFSLTILFGGNERAWHFVGGGEGIVEPDFLKCVQGQQRGKTKSPPTQPF